MRAERGGREARILVVEDEAIAALLLCRFLRSLGFGRVDQESTGRGAVNRSLKGGYDVILMDIGLADDLDGIEAARRITESRPARLIFMTGFADAEIERRAGALNPEAYLIKPLDLRRIRELLLE